MIAFMFLTVPLRRAGLLTGVWLAAAIGGIGSLAFSLSIQSFMRGMVYRLPQSRPNPLAPMEARRQDV